MKQEIIVSQPVPEGSADQWELQIHAVYKIKEEKTEKLIIITKCRKRDPFDIIASTTESDHDNMVTKLTLDIPENIAVKSICVDTKEELEKELQSYQHLNPLYFYSLEEYEAKYAERMMRIHQFSKKLVPAPTDLIEDEEKHGKENPTKLKTESEQKIATSEHQWRNVKMGASVFLGLAAAGIFCYNKYAYKDKDEPGVSSSRLTL